MQYKIVIAVLCFEDKNKNLLKISNQISIGYFNLIGN